MSLCLPRDPTSTTLDIGFRSVTSIRLHPRGRNGVLSTKWKAMDSSNGDDLIGGRLPYCSTHQGFLSLAMKLRGRWWCGCCRMLSSRQWDGEGDRVRRWCWCGGGREVGMEMGMWIFEIRYLYPLKHQLGYPYPYSNLIG